MASIVLSSIGTSVGNMILPGVGGRLLGSFSRRIGKQLDEDWGLSSASEGGSRLENFKVQDSSYGTPIPVVFGCARVAGNVIWVSGLIETTHHGSSIGGKGGGFSTSSTTYSYSLNCAVALCAGEIGGIQTIWADSKIIYQAGAWVSGTVESASFYMGADDQPVDPLLESWIGEGLSPAYRGTAYVVLEGLQLANFGNRLPNLTFEILPKNATGKPEWLGMDDPDMYHAITSTRNQAMLPLTIEGSALRARKMIVGGYIPSGSAASFVVAEYDVTGDEPIELARTQSPSFTASSVAGHDWAMADDGRFVAMALQDGSTGKYCTIILYDSQTRSFGTPVLLSMALSESKKVAWIDAQRFVIVDYSGGKRGVRVFMRSGLSVVDLGFHDVWGAGSQISRVSEMYAQFVPYADGLLNLVVNQAPAFSLMEARHLAWKNNELIVENSFTLLSGVSTGSGNGGQAYLFKTGEEEWTFFYGTTIDMRLFSFTPGKTSATITRPWQTLTNSSFSVCRCHAPVLIGNKIVVAQRSSVENYYRLSDISLLSSNFSLTADGTLLENFENSGLHFSVVAVNASRLLLSANWGNFGDLGRLDLIKRKNTGDTMDQIVGKILTRAGYAAGDYDLSALEDVEVDGYVLAGQATGASAIEPLQILQPFDLVESGSQLRAVRRGAGQELALSTDEAGAVEEGKETSPILDETRMQEIALPVEVSVDYEDASRDYETGSQKARRRVTKGSRNVAKIVLPLVMNGTDAKRVAEDRLFAAWNERTSYRFFLSRSWLGIEPGDVVDLDETRMRVTQVRLKDGLVRIDALSCPKNVLLSPAYADSGVTEGGHLKQPLATSLYLMDVPLLRAEDDAPGIYVAVSGLDGWGGASLWRAADGVSFAQQASFSKAAVAGSAASSLPARAVHYRDRESALYVQLLQGELSSCSESDLMNGGNAALVGSEIIQFKSATLLGPGLYLLSDLLRGRKGTESQTGTHAVGERFVLLSSAAMQFLPAQLSDRNLTYNFRAVSNGSSIDLAQDLALTYGLKTIEPLAPAHIKWAKQTSGDVVLSWVRRARKNAAWVDYIDVPLDEDAELYDVEIVSGSLLVRTFEDIGETFLTYTAAQQTADGISGSFQINVYQKSARYGRGQAGSAEINA